MSAILAIWNDCCPGREAVYEAWYREEHLVERLSLPGFQVGRRYVALDAPRAYFTTYEVQQTQVLSAPDYLARLENPTPRTRDIMANGFQNMSRTICTRTRVTGAIRGVYAVTAAWTGAVDHSACLDDATICAEAVHVERWVAADRQSATVTSEESLRGADQKIAECLLLEFSSEACARAGLMRLRQVAADATIGLYQKICELREVDLR